MRRHPALPKVEENIGRRLSPCAVTCRIVPLEVETHAQAVRLAQQQHLSVYDTHIMAAAITMAPYEQLQAELLHSRDILQKLKEMQTLASSPQQGHIAL